MNPKPYWTSNLQRIFVDTHGLPQLAMADITSQTEYHTFKQLSDFVLTDLRYPHAPSPNHPTAKGAKRETYGWSSARFSSTTKTLPLRHGSGTYDLPVTLRQKEFEIDDLSVFIADIDNARVDRPIVSLKQITDKLAAVEHFVYTSHSHTESEPAFRVVIDLDRPITRHEQRTIFTYLQSAVFGDQGDTSIYDSPDFLFGPSHKAVSRYCSGSALSVDAVLSAAQRGMTIENRAWLDGFETVPAPSKTKRAAQPVATGPRRFAGPVSISNPKIFRQEWRCLYGAPGTSHFKTMRSLLMKIWLKTEGSLSADDLSVIFDEIDGLDTSYFAEHHGAAKKAALIDWIRSVDVEPAKRQPKKAAA